MNERTSLFMIVFTVVLAVFFYGLYKNEKDKASLLKQENELNASKISTLTHEVEKLRLELPDENKIVNSMEIRDGSIIINYEDVINGAFTVGILNTDSKIIIGTGDMPLAQTCFMNAGTNQPNPTRNGVHMSDATRSGCVVQ